MASGSRGRGQESASSGAGADAQDTLTNPDLAHLSAADLVARLNRDDRSESDFADVLLVLALRERRLAEAEDRGRKADEEAADLQDTKHALELRLRAANTEALARRKRNSLGSDTGGISGGERAVAREHGHQSLASLEPQIGAAKLTGGEISEAVAGKRKMETKAAFVSQEREEEPLKKKPKPAGALGAVAYEDSDSDSQAQAMEAQEWKKLDTLRAYVDAWESEYDAADAAQGTLQAAAAAAIPPPVEEVQTVIEAEARETSEATVARIQEEIILCMKRIEEEVNDGAKKTEERLWAEITECKEKAAKTEAVLWDDIIQAHTSAVTQLEVWKASATEAQAQIRAASMTVARLFHESDAWKQRASETETRLQTQDQDIARLKDKVVESESRLAKAECWIRVSNFELTRLEDKIEATRKDSANEVETQIRRATMMNDDDLRALELKVANLEARGSDISRSDRTVAIDENNHSRMVLEKVHRVVPTGAIKKARRQKGVSFYDEAFKSEMEKRKFIAGNEENEESLKKQAADAASKELYGRCLPYLPTQLGSQTVEENSGEEACDT